LSVDFQRLVKLGKIIVHRVERDRARVVFDLVSERVSTTNFAAWLKRLAPLGALGHFA
jgi:hypothetical protein